VVHCEGWGWQGGSFLEWVHGLQAGLWLSSARPVAVCVGDTFFERFHGSEVDEEHFYAR